MRLHAREMRPVQSFEGMFCTAVSFAVPMGEPSSKEILNGWRTQVELEMKFKKYMQLTRGSLASNVR